jgi:hypothetical protein
MSCPTRARKTCVTAVLFRRRGGVVRPAAVLALVLAATVVGTWFVRPAPLMGPLRSLKAHFAVLAADARTRMDPENQRLVAGMGAADETAQVAARDRLTAMGEEAVPLLIDSLRHRDPQMRASAALVLGNLAHPRSLAPLAAVVDDPDEMVRFRAAYALGRLAVPEIVPPLIPLLRDPSPDVVNVTIRALESGSCKVRLRDPEPGFLVLPEGEEEWRVVAP